MARSGGIVRTQCTALIRPLTTDREPACPPSKHFKRNFAIVLLRADLYNTPSDFEAKFYQKDCFLHSDTID
jgi:hypothetical protein